MGIARTVVMVGIGEDQRPAQAIDLVHNHAVDLAQLDVGQQAAEGRAIHIPPPVKPPSS
jgi:hypothetical protein